MIRRKEQLLSNPRLCKAIFGMSREEIEKLLPMFNQCLIAYRNILKPLRMRKIGGGRKGDLPDSLDKLLYILMYLKLYPTYDALSVLADHQRSKCGDSVKLFLPVLEMALGRNLSLPKRKASDLEEIFKRCPELKDVFLDGTERKVQRPKNLRKRKKLYSGKKKVTTRKNMILNNQKRGILYMSPTKSGRRHDKRFQDKCEIAKSIPPKVGLWTDTGFVGIEKDHPNTVMPQKTSKNHPLTYQQKQENKLISSIRVVSEHAIGGYKRFKAASDTYRNHIANLDDKFNLIAAGLWNFHLGQTV